MLLPLGWRKLLFHTACPVSVSFIDFAVGQWLWSNVKNIDCRISLLGKLEEETS